MSGNSGHVIDGKGKAREAPEKKPRPARKVVPIVFVPGIAGSNLRTKPDQRAQVRKDLELAESKPLPHPWAPPAWPSPLKKALKLWKGFSARERQILLNHETTEVDDRGFLDGGARGITPENLHSAERSFRGWDSVNGTCYFGILSYLEALEPWVNARHQEADPKPAEGLSAKELPYLLQRIVPGSSFEGNLRELEKRGLGACRIPLATAQKVCQYCLPVFAVGYNWLQSNKKSAANLLSAIARIIDIYNKAEAADGSRPFTCGKVVLVTHSMGGLVARSAFKTDRGRTILGMVHFVMPAAGSPAAYRRMAAGTERGGFGEDPPVKLANAAAILMGWTQQLTTPVMANNPGCLELLPTMDHPPGWLVAAFRRVGGKHDPIFRLPINDPYEEIYKKKRAWYRLVDHELMNPAKLLRHEKIDFWKEYLKNLDRAKSFHREIKKYPPAKFPVHACIIDDPRKPAFGTVRWLLTHFSRPIHLTKGRALTLAVKNAAAGGAHRSTVARENDFSQPAELTWEIQDPEDPGDGTVPSTSAIVPKHHGLDGRIYSTPGYSHAFAGWDVGIQDFTTWAICKAMEKME